MTNVTFLMQSHGLTKDSKEADWIARELIFIANANPSHAVQLEPRCRDLLRTFLTRQLENISQRTLLNIPTLLSSVFAGDEELSQLIAKRANSDGNLEESPEMRTSGSNMMKILS